MIGQLFGKWRVIEAAPSFKGKQYFCSCLCGFNKILKGTELRSGRTTQCTTCQYKMLYDPEREIGKQYGKWKIIKYVTTHKRLHRFECICQCGTIGIHSQSELKSGKSTQCRVCHNRQVASADRKNPKGRINSIHSLEYSVWSGMKRRCYDQTFSRYPQYGGRGIKICDRWHKFENFLSDMGARPNGLTIERIDNNGDYEPGNCKWATFAEQNKNKGGY